MATVKQIEANRRNALKSTGPRTESGKNRVAENAIRHGLCSSTLVFKPVRHEDPEKFLEMRAETIRSWNPQGARELQLAEMIANAFLRVQRAENFESSYFSGAMDTVQNKLRVPAGPTANDDLGCGIVFGKPEHELTWKNIDRYRRNAWLDYNRAVAALEKMQKERRLREAAEDLLSVPQPVPEQEVNENKSELALFRNQPQQACTGHVPASENHSATAEPDVNSPELAA